jgi:hypothetical protein
MAPLGAANGEFTRAPAGRLLDDCGIPCDAPAALEMGGVPGNGVPPPTAGPAAGEHAETTSASAETESRVFIEYSIHHDMT